MTIRERQIREQLIDVNINNEKGKELLVVLRSILNSEFNNEIKEIERSVKI